MVGLGQSLKELGGNNMGRFRELFMGKYFPTSARHAKSRDFLELKQGTMIMLKYVANFTELAHFVDDYVAIDMAKVRKFSEIVHPG